MQVFNNNGIQKVHDSDVGSSVTKFISNWVEPLERYFVKKTWSLMNEYTISKWQGFFVVLFFWLQCDLLKRVWLERISSVTSFKQKPFRAEDDIIRGDFEHMKKWSKMSSSPLWCDQKSFQLQDTFWADVRAQKILSAIEYDQKTLWSGPEDLIKDVVPL